MNVTEEEVEEKEEEEVRRGGCCKLHSRILCCGFAIIKADFVLPQWAQ